MPEEDAPITASEKSYANLYDLGLNTPESNERLEVLRQTVIDVAVNLQRDDNLKGFKNATARMFKEFGIPPSDDPSIIAWNDKVLADAYNSRWKLEQTDSIVDLMFKGTGGI